jgi:hypothetical protein
MKRAFKRSLLQDWHTVFVLNQHFCDNPTLNRFYSFHYLFPFILAALSLAHLAALHQYGSTNPLGIPAQTDLVDFYPYFYVKDLVATLALAAFAAWLVGFYPEVLGHPDNNIPANPYSTPAHIVPEYFCSLIYGNIVLNNPIRCGKILETEKTTGLQPVKRFFLYGQSAREGQTGPFEQGRYPTEELQLKRALSLRQMPSLQRLNIGHPDSFMDWFCGLIDGDGNFYFTQSQKGTWIFALKISQSNYNLKLLTYLKKKLKCGSVKKAGDKASQYYVKNPELLYYELLPMFSAHPFLTRKKAWQFCIFQQALEVYIQGKTGQLSRGERDLRLKDLLQQSKQIPAHFILSHPLNDPSYPPLGWVLGFTEAEGSFYLNLKKKECLVHVVSWAQKDEKELLEALCFKFKIQAKVVECTKKGFSWYKLSTASVHTIENLIPLFENKIKGIKAVEVRKWARSFRKYRGNFKALSKLQTVLREAKKHSSSKRLLLWKPTPSQDRVKG